LKREIFWAHAAVEDLHAITSRDSRLAMRLMHLVRIFGAGGRTDLRKLEGSERWRIRSGDWRIILRLAGDSAYVLGVTDRKDTY